MFRVDPNYIKDMQINWESFVIVRDKKFDVAIGVLLMTCLFDLFLTCLLDLVDVSLVQFHFHIAIISMNDKKGDFKLYFLKDFHLKMFT